MKAKFGAIVVDGRGKIGGHVASKNRAGSYFRTKVTPVNPSTSFQSAVRARFASLSQAWRDLTAAQIAAFNGAVDRFTRTDIFGDIRNPSGMNLFMRLNLNILSVGGLQINTPPQDTELESATDFTVTGDISDTSLEISWNPLFSDANTCLVVEATPPLSPGVSYVKNKFRKIGQTTSATTGPVDYWAQYVAKFGAPVAGDRICVRISTINEATGMQSQYLTQFVTFVA